MVNISEAFSLWGIQIDHQRSSHEAFVGDEVAGDFTLSAIGDVLAHNFHLLFVGQISLLKFLDNILDVDLLLELDLEDGVTALFDECGEIGHSALNFSVEVVGTERAVDQNVLGHDPSAAKLVLDADLVSLDFGDLEIRDA